MKASRAGTRGFRAPEVLFKVQHQTMAIDVWSAGVILLTMLTRRYPFFQSSDDQDAIVEVAFLFGNKAMAEAAALYGRRWQCTVPTVGEEPVGWSKLVEKLNPELWPSVPSEAYSLLEGLLNLNAKERLTAQQALNHPFLKRY